MYSCLNENQIKKVKNQTVLKIIDGKYVDKYGRIFETFIDLEGYFKKLLSQKKRTGRKRK